MEPKQLSNNEKNLLISLVEKHMDVLSDKSHNTYLINKKKEVWNTIEKSFNDSDICQAPKTVKQLQKSWDNYKARAKKLSADGGRSLFRPGIGKIDGASEPSPDIARVLAMTEEIHQLYETGDCDTQTKDRDTPEEILEDLCMHSVFASAQQRGNAVNNSLKRRITNEGGQPSKKKILTNYNETNEEDQRTIMVLRKKLLENQLKAQQELHDLERQTMELQMQTAAIKLQQAKNELSISQIELDSINVKTNS